MFENLCNYNPEPLVKPEDLLCLGIVTKDWDGKEKFIPFLSGKTYDDLRPWLLGFCGNIETEGTPYVSAYWDILPAEKVGVGNCVDFC